VETSIDDHSRSRECVRTVMCWTARRWEYISIAAIAVSNLPVSPLPITRLSRQAQATADTEPHSASTPPRDEPSSLVAIDDDSSINSWYSDSTHRQTHTQTLILLHSQPPLPRGKDVYFCWDEITYSIEKRIVLQIYGKFQGPIIPIFVEISSNLLISGILLK